MAGTGYRNRWRVGRHLVRDDLSGVVYYDDEMVKRWDNVTMVRDGNEDEIRQHPQLYVRAKRDPYPLTDVRPQSISTAAAFIDIDQVAGVTLPKGPAQHLYKTSQMGIGTMIITGGSADAKTCAKSFLVR